MANDETAKAIPALDLIRALSNPTRLRIVELLAERKDSTGPQLSASIGLPQSSLFDHLAVLRDSAIVQTSGEGPHRYYGLDPDRLDFLAAFFSELTARARDWTGLVETVTLEGRMDIRDAIPDDAAAIARIYNEGIEDRVATLETQLRTPSERAKWMEARGPRHPVLVAMEGDEISGWASLNSFNARPVYDHVADISVYVGRSRRGRGIGDALLGALEARARGIGFHKLVLAAFPTNGPGMRLYERHAFQTVGVYHEQGMLDGRWVDVIVMEKLLNAE